MSKRSPKAAFDRAPGGQNAALRTTLLQAMQKALALYSQRDWANAEQVCRMVLAAEPAHFDALNLLGIIAAQSDRSREAAEYLGRAVAIRRDDAVAHNNYGNVLRDLRRYDDALRCYNRAIQLKPNYAEAHYNRGVTLHELRRFDAALDCYDRALKLNPAYAAACNNRGVTLRELKRLDEAIRSYDQALTLRPDHAATYNNRGIALQDLKRPQDALASYSQALTLQPDYAEALNNQGNVLRELLRLEEALACFERATRLNPNYAEAHNGRGTTLLLLLRLPEALESFERALALDPTHAEAHFNRANALRDLDQLQPALESYGHALALKPDFADAFYNRGTLLHELKRFAEALQDFEQAIRIDPDRKWLYGIWLHAKMRVCDWSALDEGIAALSDLMRQAKAATPPFVVVTLTDSLQMQRSAGEIWVRETCPAQSELPPLSRRERHGRIRVGYYSADYYNHATAALAAGLFERHDRDRFEIIAFQFGPPQHDAVTDRLIGAFDQFVDVRRKTDLEVARLSRELEVDIAVDLKGYTQHQRVGIFAHRAAPIQVNYLGYPGSMGAPFIDYIIADQTLIPAASREHYSEKVVYLPGSYQVNDRQRLIAERQWSRAEVGLPADGFVFCCFNNAYKITPATFDTWMRILRRVTGSVLWLVEESETASNNLRRTAERAGVNAARLIFSPRVPTPEHLARHRLADLFIDTLPCNAHTTASDSLWAGLPVLTCAGGSFPARVAASLLNAIELPELVTTTLAEYEDLAVELAGNPSRLTELTDRLRRNRLTTPLFDTAAFAVHLEAAYIRMYERYIEGLAADHITVG